jgi:hypothetical protein
MLSRGTCGIEHEHPQPNSKSVQVGILLLNAGTKQHKISSAQALKVINEIASID